MNLREALRSFIIDGLYKGNGQINDRKQIYGILLGTAALMLASGTVDGIAELISDARAL